MSKEGVSTHRSITSMIAPLDRALGIALASLLATAGLALADAPIDEGVERFDVLRLRADLVRVDTRTGQIWLAPLGGEGGWLALGEPVVAAEASEDGRFVVKALAPSHATRIGEPRSAPELIRMDLEEGGVWKTHAVVGSSWMAVEDPTTAAPVP
jgi:hypothetical protein